MKRTFVTSLVLLLLCSSTAFAQKSPVNFNKITPQDFVIDPATVDTSYGAVILADVGSSSFEANSKGYFSIVFKVQRRIKILSPKGFDIATVKIPLYKSRETNDEELLEKVQCITYNLVNGKVEETKLDNDNIFKEVVDKKRVIKKFTMPAVKEGSIVDISYTINSTFLFNLQPWRFQGSYPRLWSEYNLNLPSFFEYVTLTKGTEKYFVHETKEKYQNFVVRIPSDRAAFVSDDFISLNSKNTIVRWVMKDVPALKEESFTSSMDNYIARIEFQLSGIQWPDQPHKEIIGSWAKACTELLKDKDFAAEYKDENNWATAYLADIISAQPDTLARAKAIYAKLQKEFSSSDEPSGIYLSRPLKETFSSKKGESADINHLLTLLLKKGGINAYPVVLSTRANGLSNNQFPFLSQYNKVICKVETAKGNYFLDASNPLLKFGTLPSYCYNGEGVLIDFVTGSETLLPTAILEKKITSVSLVNDAGDKNKWSGILSTMPGYFESISLKEEIKEKGQKAFAKRITDSYSGDYSADNVASQNSDNNEEDFSLSYNINISRDPGNNIIYFNPMLKEGLKENYFKNPNRKYPVELPYKMDETYLFNLQIPEGYVLDETPKSTRVTLNETDGFFEYIISKDDEQVSLKTQLKLNKTFYPEEEYETLRDFIDYVVKKHAEQIVLKKK